EHSLKWDWDMGPDAFTQRTPTGIPEQHWLLSSEIAVQVIKPLSIVCNGSLQWIQNNNHQLGDNILGLEFILSAKYTF
ncbi:MAG: hypothetical protein LDL24_12035, partial [Treponema sp.]|nr:hypothetical protein [Treponema sp.]